jgi:hypothetical protein
MSVEEGKFKELTVRFRGEVLERERERENRLLLSWAKAGKDSGGRSKATRSEGDDLEESAARALMRQGGGTCSQWERLRA